MYASSFYANEMGVLSEKNCKNSMYFANIGTYVLTGGPLKTRLKN